MLSIGQKIELLKVVAHPVRIRILEELSKGVKCVSDFEEFLSLRQPNVSQHLTLLRHYGVVDYYMDGRLRCYFLVNPIDPRPHRVAQKGLSGISTKTCVLSCHKKGCISRGKEEVNYRG